VLDVTDAGSVREAVARAKRTEGAVSVLINNAGFGQAGAVEEVPLERVRRQVETDVCGLVKMCQLELPGTRCPGSERIVNLSSMSDRLTFPGDGFYHATKHAVEAISDALRFEVMGFGIQVMVIEPGLIRTRFSEFAIDSMGEGIKEVHTQASTPPWRGPPEELASAAYSQGPGVALKW
jgi:NAD(P)-dependent dehydrogenase (short-subunit alcohol dehydrogenase family)